MDIEKKLQECCNAAAASWRKPTMETYEQTKQEIISYVHGLEARVAELEAENGILMNIVNGFSIS